MVLIFPMFSPNRGLANAVIFFFWGGGVDKYIM